MCALYQISVRQATISLSLLLACTLRCRPWESLWGSSATTPLVDFHHRLTACPSYQLELRTHSEFGANLSVTPGGFAFLCLRAIPRRSSPAGYHSLRLRPAKTKPQYLLLHPAMPNPRDERLIYTSHHPVRWPFRRRPHLLN